MPSRSSSSCMGESVKKYRFSITRTMRPWLRQQFRLNSCTAATNISNSRAAAARNHAGRRFRSSANSGSNFSTMLFGLAGQLSRVPTSVTQHSSESSERSHCILYATYSSHQDAHRDLIDMLRKMGLQRDL